MIKRDKLGRFTKANKNKTAETNYRPLLTGLTEEMSKLDAEIDRLEEEAKADPGDIPKFRAMLLKQVELINLMLDSLDLLEKARQEGPKKASKKKCKYTKNKCNDIPEEVFKMLKPILDELGVDPKDIAKAGTINVEELPDGICIRGSIDIEDEPPTWCRKKS